MSTAAHPIRYLDSPLGIKVLVIGRPRDGYVLVRNAQTAREFETPL